MASRDSLEMRKLLAKGTVIQAGTDGPVAFRLRKIGSETATSVTVTTATNIVLVGSTTTDTLAFATYTTIGAVVDAINATGRWEAKILDALRSLASASTLVNGAVSATQDKNGLVIWEVKQDTSASLQIAVCLSPFREFDSPKGHLVKLQELAYDTVLGSAAADSVQIYLRNSDGTEVKVFSTLSVHDGTATTINFAGGEGFISGDVDGDIVALVKDAATLSDATTNYVRVTGLVE